jgi:single-strand DNA-binding protein
MYSLNRSEFIGRLGADPDLDYTEQGTARCTFRIAVNERWTDGAGHMQERTDWFRVAAFGRRGEIAAEYLRTGSRVYVAGRLRTTHWQDTEGQTRYGVELRVEDLILLDRPTGQSPIDDVTDDVNPRSGTDEDAASTPPVHVRTSNRNADQQPTPQRVSEAAGRSQRRG